VSRAAALAALLGIAGCGSSPPAPAEGAVIVQIGPGPDVGQNDASVCDVPTQTFAVPDDYQDVSIEPEVIRDGEESDGAGGAVHVRCRVRAEGGAFDVDTALTADDGRSVAISGTMSRASSNAQASIAMGGVTFTSQGPCSIDFTASEGMDIQSGRVWAVITCPHVTDGRGHACFASAEFLFDTCQQ
jgi:hypothetical protein